jgi:hypothetical protein
MRGISNQGSKHQDLRHLILENTADFLERPENQHRVGFDNSG